MTVVRSAIELLQQQPGLFFAEGRATDRELIARVTHDISVLAPVTFQIQAKDGFIVVSADVDWMAHASQSVAALFTTFQSPSYKAPNAHRAEVLIAAAASSWVSLGEAGDVFSSGDVQAALRIAEASSFRARSLVWISVGN